MTTKRTIAEATAFAYTQDVFVGTTEVRVDMGECTVTQMTPEDSSKVCKDTPTTPGAPESAVRNIRRRSGITILWLSSRTGLKAQDSHVVGAQAHAARPQQVKAYVEGQGPLIKH